MQINWLRASSFKTFKDCQFKYFLNHDVGIESKAGKKANLGTITHWVLEQMAKAKRINKHEKHPVLLDPKHLLDVAWKRYTGLYDDHTYDNKDYKFCVDQINAVLETDYHPYNLDVVATEKQFEIKIDKPGFKEFGIRGTIDLITQHGTDILEVIDYKTGERSDWITGEEINERTLKHDIQFRIYDLAIRKIYPGYKNYVYTMFFTRNGGPFTVDFTDEEREHTFDILYKAQQTIRDTEAPSRLKDDKSRSLQLFKCKHVCQFGKTYAVLAAQLDAPENIILEYLPVGTQMGDIITRDEVEYLVTDVMTQCDYYHSFLPHVKDAKSLASEIVSLTVKGETVSARNDYGGPKIYKGTIS